MIINRNHWYWYHAQRYAQKQTIRPHDLVFTYIKCMDCDNRATCWDHRDYMKPNEVDPVCKKCNYKRGSARPFHTRELSRKRRINFINFSRERVRQIVNRAKREGKLT